MVGGHNGPYIAILFLPIYTHNTDITPLSCDSELIGIHYMSPIKYNQVSNIDY